MVKQLKRKEKILVAMSGGVDSSVAAAMLKKQSYIVIGVFLKFWSPPSATQTCADKKYSADLRRQNICCNQEALRSARSVANQLKIPFYVFDVEEEFKREVVDYYEGEYDSGRTPNPCVVCNKKIKFGWLLQKAKKLGCEYLATGHYARLWQKFSIFNFQFSNKSQTPILKLLKAKDPKKDQTYFLWQLDQDQLKHILFPLGNYTKPEVRKLAKKWNLPVYNKKESQNVCFVPDNDNASFLKKYVKKLTKSGNIVDKRGNILGKHEGLYKYTIGQRHGLSGIQIRSTKHEIRNKFRNSKFEIRDSGFQPAYVIKLNIDKNELVVGVKEDLYSKELIATNVNWIDSKRKTQNAKLKTTVQNLKLRCLAKIRYGHVAASCKLKTPVVEQSSLRGRAKNKKLKTIEVIFDKPQRAITPGQSVVFYEGDEIVGGGVIK